MQKMFSKSKSFAVVFLLTLVFAGASKAQAQENHPVVPAADGNFQLSPLRYDWRMELGEEKKAIVTVKNSSSKPVEIEVDVQDFSVDESLESNSNFFVPNENHPLKAYDVINWIAIDKAPFRLEAGESRQLEFSAKIPAKTPTGGYYGVIFFTKKPMEDNTNLKDGAVTVNVLTRMGLLLTFGVQGDGPIVEQGSLKLFKPTKKVFINNPISFDTQVSNTGNFPFKVSGTVEIFKGDKKVETLEVAPRVLYPDRTRSVVTPSWTASFAEMGKYQAKLHLVSEDGKIAIDGQTSFLLLPWKVMAIVFVILVAVWVIFSVGVVSANQENKKK
ncbi:MAG: hypothetical protein WCJ51_00110 [Candidatus Moraniibacteriota bacterium]